MAAGLGFGAADAQQVTAALNPPVIGSGQSAEYVIKYEGPQTQVEALPEPAAEGLEFNGPSNSKEFRFDNRNGSTFTENFSWQVTAREPGSYTVPAQSLTINGQTYTTGAVTLEVREGPPPEPSLEPILRLAVQKTELYVGEVTPVTITAYFHRRTALHNYDHPKLPRENFVVKRFPPAGPAAPVQINGERYQPIQFNSSVSAMKEGDLLLGPATLQSEIYFPEAGGPDEAGLPQNFPRTFFNRSASRRSVTLTSESVRIKVKPLPTEGRPASFSGAVGHFTLNAQLSQRGGELRVGEPLAVDLVIAGQGNFDILSAPVLTDAEGWKLYPAKVTQENRSTGLEPGVQIFNQALVPQKVLREVPPFEIAFFDPVRGRYEIARSDAIPIVIRPDDARPAAEEPAAGAGTATAAAKDFALADAAAPEEKLADILLARPAGGPLLSLTLPPPDDKAFWLAQVLPAALLLTLVAGGWYRRWKERVDRLAFDRATQPRELAAIRREMRRPGLARREFYALAREYLRAWEFRARQPAPVAEAAVGEVLQRQSRYSYSGDTEEAVEATPPTEVTTVLATLEKLPR